MPGAPYRFARINRFVHFPDWAGLVSHDVPFADGFCGTIRFDIEAMTPLLVGGPRERKGNAAGDVWPVRLPDGRFAIPPSSLQGMVRAILTVAAFGRLAGRVEDRRFAVRDLSGTGTSKLLFQQRLTRGRGTEAQPYVPNTKAGWLVRRGGKVAIVPCAHARIRIADLCALPGAAGAVANVLKNRTTADLRLQALSRILPGLALRVNVQQPANHPHTPGLIHYARCTPAAGAGGTVGTVVLTGKPQPGIDTQRAKKMEFVFHTPDRAGAKAQDDIQDDIDVPADVWRDFLDIHQPPRGSGRNENPNWSYWKKDFERGEPVPIFYLQEAGRVTAMGTAFMFKAAMPLSTHDLLRNSSADHVDTRPDLATLIFGAVEGAHDAASLKRRASFGFAHAPATCAMVNRETALLSPKPAYYPNYVRQHPHPGNKIPDNLPHAAYAGFAGLGSRRERPELAGTKLFPARGSAVRQALDLQVPAQVSTNLHALAAGARFPNVPLRVHNLREIEVGALLWALCFGRAEHLAGMESPLRHRLGMGKPLGLGEIRIGNVTLDLEANDGRAVPDAAGFIAAFVDHMKAHYPGGGWDESVQVEALLKAADPGAAHGELGYFAGPKAYSDARQRGEFLPDYVEGHEVRETHPPSRQGAGGGGGGGHAHTGGHGGGPRRAPQAFRAGQKVTVDDRPGTILMEEGGEYMVAFDDGTEGSFPPSAITPA